MNDLNINLELLANRIKSLRKEARLTQEQLADEVGISRSMIGEIERAVKAGSSKTLNKLATYFNVSIDYLLGNSNLRSVQNISKEETENLAEDFIDMLIKHGKIKSKEDLTHQNVLKFLNEIFNEIDNN